MTNYAVPDPAEVQAKAQADLQQLCQLLQQLSQQGLTTHVQVSWTPIQAGCPIGHSFGFPPGMDLEPPADAAYWQTKDNSYRVGYRQGYDHAQHSRPYNENPN